MRLLLSNGVTSVISRNLIAGGSANGLKWKDSLFQYFLHLNPLGGWDEILAAPGFTIHQYEYHSPNGKGFPRWQVLQVITFKCWAFIVS